MLNQMTNFDEKAEGKEIITVDENGKWYRPYENQCEGSSKAKHRSNM